MSLLSTSGGLFYHLRAARYSQSLWQPHRKSVEGFLNEWNPAEKAITLIGPSAGYSLPLDWLKRFDQIHVFEPDALARLMLKKRLHSHQIKVANWYSELTWKDDFVLPAGAVLFCNVLGQISVHSQRLKEMLNHRTWASYHDAFFSRSLSFQSSGEGDLSFGKKVTRAQVSEWARQGQVNEGTDSGQIHELIELDGFDLFSDREAQDFAYWEWTLAPHRRHLIEGCFRHHLLKCE